MSIAFIWYGVWFSFGWSPVRLFMLFAGGVYLVHGSSVRIVTILLNTRCASTDLAMVVSLLLHSVLRSCVNTCSIIWNVIAPKWEDEGQVYWYFMTWSVINIGDALHSTLFGYCDQHSSYACFLHFGLLGGSSQLSLSGSLSYVSIVLPLQMWSACNYSSCKVKTHLPCYFRGMFTTSTCTLLLSLFVVF